MAHSEDTLRVSNHLFAQSASLDPSTELRPDLPRVVGNSLRPLATLGGQQDGVYQVLHRSDQGGSQHGSSSEDHAGAGGSPTGDGQDRASGHSIGDGPDANGGDSNGFGQGSASGGIGTARVPCRAIPDRQDPFLHPFATNAEDQYVYRHTRNLEKYHEKLGEIAGNVCITIIIPDRGEAVKVLAPKDVIEHPALRRFAKFTLHLVHDTSFCCKSLTEHASCHTDSSMNTLTPNLSYFKKLFALRKSTVSEGKYWIAYARTRPPTLCWPRCPSRRIRQSHLSCHQWS